KIASLTQEGWEAVQHMAPHHVASVRGLLVDTLDDKDVKDLTRITRKITTSLDADHWILNSEISDLEH
ncbi:MarR family transcriptional regulator, partial [Escherichia coli]|nr:MarR family transcriptional regulator [Escherichia coli]